MKDFFFITSLLPAMLCFVFQAADEQVEFEKRLNSEFEMRPESSQPQVYRIWRSKTGEHRTKAKFIGFDETDVIIEKEPKRINVPIESLSDSDIKFVEDIRTAKASDSFSEKQKSFLFSTTWHPSQRLTWEYPENTSDAKFKTKALFNKHKNGRYSGSTYLTFKENGFELNRDEAISLESFPYDRKTWRSRIKILSPGHISVLDKELVWIVFRSLRMVD